ncbi:MAG: thioredoxin [Candidatus Tyloplasma litorale]|nr:MAG: thioredoxin [Mycoplasmatales bacterium]
MAQKVNINEATELINSGEKVIIDFFATWCGPCQMLLPIYDEISIELHDVKMVKIDIDEEPDFASNNGITSVPTIVAFKNGKEVSRVSGFRNKEDLISFIKGI